VIKGPGINVFSAGLAKEFLFGEHAKLRWEMTATNFFNHPNWANPSTDITDTTGVGVITSDGGITSGSVGDRSGARAFRMAFASSSSARTAIEICHANDGFRLFRTCVEVGTTPRKDRHVAEIHRVFRVQGMDSNALPGFKWSRTEGRDSSHSMTARV